MSRELTQPVYLQLAKRERWSRDGDLKVISAGQKRPRTRVPDSVLIKLVIAVPSEAFDPITVTAIQVPLGDIERPVVVVEVPEPAEDED